MRLNAWLARAGVASRRGADELIRAGRVTVDGAPGALTTVVPAGAAVALDGVPLARQPLAYVLLHKPAGVVTTARDPGGRPTVVGLVDHPTRVVPVGRLDADTTGALLLTNDGALAHRLSHPRYGVDKVYVAEVRGAPTPARLDTLARGVELDDGPTAPAKVAAVSPGLLRIVIHEGRNRQVRRMCDAVGHPVLRLVRTRIGPIADPTLAPGEYRELSHDEVRRLAAATSGPRPSSRQAGRRETPE
jgi:23S rRNA pseudouridine2605 synthase